jgi:hypothetical protein
LLSIAQGMTGREGFFKSYTLRQAWRVLDKAY